MQKVILIILVLTVLFSSCRKENVSNDCGRLKDGIATNDIGKVKTVLTNFIDGLHNKDYTESNINSLLQSISSSCNVTVELGCFDCIKTLPSQTEIRILINSPGVSKAKTIDLSYTSANKIVFHNMHD